VHDAVLPPRGSREPAMAAPSRMTLAGRAGSMRR
jgi:hypothetical protein